MVLAGVALLACGLAFKMGAAPFHMWMPDTLEGSPTPVAGFLAVGPKIAVLAVAARIFLTSFSSLHELWGPLFWTISALTILLGEPGRHCPGGRQTHARLLQHRPRRLPAHRSRRRRQSDGRGDGGHRLYLAAYTFMNLGAFGTLLWFEKKTGESVTWRGLAGMHRRAPLMSLLFSLFMFSLAGIPPMAGFIGKFWVFVAGWRAGHYGLVLIGAAGSLVGSFYYLRTIYALYMLPDEEAPRLSTEFSPLVCALLLMALGVLAIGVAPQFVMVLAGRAIPY